MSGNPATNDQTEPGTLSWSPVEDQAASRDLTGAVLGDFAIERRLGRGGMGEVYLARQVSLNRYIALKVIRPDLLANPATLARFEKEAWTAAKLNDPNVVHIYAIGSIDKVRFIAMEYVQGTNLKDYLARKGTPELPLALSIMKQSANAVRAAGEMGLIHRDIKPENILLTKRGLVKVADFGLCRDLNEESAQGITQQGVTMGTPLYMSPEQALGDPLDHRSDLYSLGITYYQMLAGEPPFRADNPMALALKHVKAEPPDLASRRPDLPVDLCRLVMKLIAKAPADRYQSAAEMLKDLAKVRESLQVSAASPVIPGLTASMQTVGSVSDQNLSPTLTSGAVSVGDSPQVRSYRWVLPTVAVLLFALGLLVGWETRTNDLLSPRVAESKAPPALWMSADWGKIPKKSTAALQYRYAQLEAPESLREAAWIAVPGYHPSATDWVSHAYTQLGRALFLERDAERLEVFAAELKETERSHDGALSAILHVGVGVLRNDPDAVLNNFSNSVKNLSDPGLAGLSLEITNEAILGRRLEKLSNSRYSDLANIQRMLILKMFEILLKDTLGRTGPP